MKSTYRYQRKSLCSVLLREIGQSDKEQEKHISIGMYRYRS